MTRRRIISGKIDTASGVDDARSHQRAFSRAGRTGGASLHKGAIPGRLRAISEPGPTTTRMTKAGGTYLSFQSAHASMRGVDVLLSSLFLMVVWRRRNCRPGASFPETDHAVHSWGQTQLPGASCQAVLPQLLVARGRSHTHLRDKRPLQDDLGSDMHPAGYCEGVFSGRAGVPHDGAVRRLDRLSPAQAQDRASQCLVAWRMAWHASSCC